MDMIAEAEAQQRAVAEAEDGNVDRLARLRGIGLTFASVLGNEVFFTRLPQPAGTGRLSRARA
jgi:hypothetical protein